MEAKQIQWFDSHFYRVGEEFYPSVTTILGVTNKPFLNAWKADLGQREADQRMNEAGDQGTRIHHTCQSLMSGGIALFNPLYRPAYTRDEIQVYRDKYDHNLHVVTDQFEWLRIIRFVEWIKIVKPIYIASEVIVYDEENKVAGSLDYLFYVKRGKYAVNGRTPVEIPEGLSVWDLKSGKYVDDDADIQVSKYTDMLSKCIQSGKMSFDQEDIKVKDIVGGGIIHVQANIRTALEGVGTKFMGTELVRDNADYFDRNLLPVWRRRNRNASPRIFEMPSILEIKKEK